jgi:hypothetical protein
MFRGIWVAKVIGFGWAAVSSLSGFTNLLNKTPPGLDCETRGFQWRVLSTERGYYDGEVLNADSWFYGISKKRKKSLIIRLSK